MRRIAALLLAAGLLLPAIRFGSYLHRQGKRGSTPQASVCKVEVKLIWKEKEKEKVLLMINGREAILSPKKSTKVGPCRVKFMGLSGERVVLIVNGRTIKK